MDTDQTRRRDTGLCPMADRSGSLQGRTIIASSDIPTTPAPTIIGMYYDHSVHGSSIQPPPTPIRLTQIRMPPTSHAYYTPIPYQIHDSLHPYNIIHTTQHHVLMIAYAFSSHPYVQTTSSILTTVHNIN